MTRSLLFHYRNQALGGLTGHQHGAGSAINCPNSGTGVFRAAVKLITEEGFRGLFRGVEVQIVRGFLGAG